MQIKSRDVKKLPREKNTLRKELFQSMSKSFVSWKSFRISMQISVKKISMLMNYERQSTPSNSRLVFFRL